MREVFVEVWYLWNWMEFVFVTRCLFVFESKRKCLLFLEFLVVCLTKSFPASSLKGFVSSSDFSYVSRFDSM